MDESKIIECFEEFVSKKYYADLLQTLRKGKKSLLIDFEDLDKFDVDCADALLAHTEETLELFEEALSHLDIPTKEKIFIRFHNIPDSRFYRLRDLRSVNLGSFIVIEGLIRQASEVRPEVIEVTYECIECGAQIRVLQSGFTIKKPARCACQKTFFKEVGQKFVDIQSIKLEENPEHMQGSEQPSRIDILLRNDLVDPELRQKLTPGNYVKIIGILKEMPTILKGGKKSRRYDIFIETNYAESTVTDFEKIVLTPEDEKEILEFSKTPNLKDVFTEAICPSIFGHEKIKYAIALQLFAGVAKVRSDGMRTRGDIHILLVGDPGAGKSQLLQYVKHVAPKSIYVSGTGASAAGLTAAVVKDEFLGGWTLEAGAMVLAHKGIAMIDEMDKMNKDDRLAMHEVMEQQIVSISKANIHSTLKAQTAVLAAANPVASRFDTHEEIAGQIDMPSSLLSRFDLIFVIQDMPNRSKDTDMAEHILKLHKDPDFVPECVQIPTAFIRKYVAYARRNCNPKLSRQAMDEIKNFFVDLRAKYVGDEQSAVPLSPRQLEALVRIAEANAKMRLSQKVVKEDAINAINLLKYYLNKIGVDPETGLFDIDRATGGIPASKRQKITAVLHVIKELEESNEPRGAAVPISKVMEALLIKGIPADEAEIIIDRLNKEGTIYKPRRDLVKRL